jgi:hypothetical protein
MVSTSSLARGSSLNLRRLCGSGGKWKRCCGSKEFNELSESGDPLTLRHGR